MYLSSFRLGAESDKVAQLRPDRHAPIGFVPNALDYLGADPKKRDAGISRDLSELSALGLSIEYLDLRQYFSSQSALRTKCAALSGLWVRGGNVFVLRQAMALSGLDVLLRERLSTDFFYGGYSAGCCVLAPSLKCYQIVDDAVNFPYPQSQETMWEGLGFLDYAFLPHFDSDHPESAEIAKELEYCIAEGLPYKTFRDGEVEIVEKCGPCLARGA